MANVRFGSISDLDTPSCDVRFAPQKRTSSAWPPTSEKCQHRKLAASLWKSCFAETVDKHLSLPTNPGIKKAAGICALRPTGLKMHSYENARPANLGTSKTEPNICHWGVANVVPCEEHAGCCETTTASSRFAQRCHSGLYA
jgi:hypothetical protein